MSRHYDMREFSVTEQVNDDKSEYFDEIRRSRSLTRKPVGNRSQSIDYNNTGNTKIKIRYNVKDISRDSDLSSRDHHHHHHHQKESLSPKTFLSIKKKPRSLSVSVRREVTDFNKHDEHHSSSRHRKDKSKDIDSKHHHRSSHSRDTKRSDLKKEASIERHYDEDNSIINYDEKKKHRKSSRHYDEELDNDKENIIPNKKKDKKSKKLLSNEDDSISLSSFSINRKHREKRLKNKVRNRESSNDNLSHLSRKESKQKVVSDNNGRISSNNIVPTYPPPMSPSIKTSSLKYSRSMSIDKGSMKSISSRSPETITGNRSLSKSRSVSISNQVSIYSSDAESVNQSSMGKSYSSIHDLPLYKSNSESIRELRESVLHKYASSEILTPITNTNEKSLKDHHNSMKRSVSNDTSKLRHSHSKTIDKNDIEHKKKKKSRSQSLSKESKSEKIKKKNKTDDKTEKEKEKKRDKKKDIEEKNGKDGGEDGEKKSKRNKERHQHKHRSTSKDQEYQMSNVKEKDEKKKIKKHANIPAPIPPEESLKKKPLPKPPKIKENEENTNENDLAIKPVKPVIENSFNKEKSSILTFYPEGYTPSINDSVKTKINEEDEDNSEKKKIKRSKSKSHSRSHSHHHRSRSKSKNRNNSVDHEDNMTNDENKKHKRHKSKVILDENSTIIEKLEEYPYDKNIFENLKKKPEDFKNSNICIHIYRTDALELNIKNVHPLVKVHIIDINTEKYLAKSSVLRPATSYYENSELEYIMPILTQVYLYIKNVLFQPYHLQRNHTNIPRWNQGLYINEDYLHVVRKNVIVFFEIIDFVEKAKDRKKDKDGWHRIAWAFLKLVGTHDLVNTEHTRRLQLYRYPKKLIKTTDPKKPEILEYWKKKLQKYQSTLFVKVYAQKIPDVREVSYRPKMPNEKEIGAWSYNQLMDIYLSKKKILDPVYKSFINFSQKPNWRREDGQMCKIPNHLHFRIDGGERGCLAAEYSHLGYLFAIASTSLNSLTTIKIFDTVSGDKIASLTGHQDLVYDIKWSRDDKHLFTASADGSVRAWSIQSETSIRSSTIFQHPSYVYCIQVHPIIGKDNKITIITGSYDGKIRFWKYDQNLYNNIEISKQAQIHHQTQFLPAYVLTGHDSTINSLAIESSGIRLFSGDGKGYIRVWSCRVNDSIGYDNYKCIKVIPTQSDPINCIRLHPNERQLLVHCLGNTIYMMDIRLFKVLTCITSLPSNQYPIKSILSPCGTYIFSGSTNGRVYVWNSMTGNLVAKYENLIMSQPIMGIAYHPLDDYISFYTYGPEQPILTYVWDSNYKPLESTLKIANIEDNKMNKMFNVTPSKFIDDEKKFPFSSFNNIDKKSNNDLNIPISLNNKQGYRKIDDSIKAKSVYI